MRPQALAMRGRPLQIPTIFRAAAALTSPVEPRSEHGAELEVARRTHFFAAELEDRRRAERRLAAADERERADDPKHAVHARTAGDTSANAAATWPRVALGFR